MRFFASVVSFFALCALSLGEYRCVAAPMITGICNATTDRFSAGQQIENYRVCYRQKVLLAPNGSLNQMLLNAGDIGTGLSEDLSANGNKRLACAYAQGAVADYETAIRELPATYEPETREEAQVIAETAAVRARTFEPRRKQICS